MEEQIIAILGRIVGAEEGELEGDLDLFESGLLDSFGVIQLFVELEEALGVTLEVETIAREQIATPDRLVQCVKQAL